MAAMTSVMKGGLASKEPLLGLQRETGERQERDKGE
jgi:hypothetical protein